MKSYSNTLTSKDVERFIKNLLVFTSPAMVVFFTQLSMGVPPKAAALLALLILYGLLADLFKKYKQERTY